MKEIRPRSCIRQRAFVLVMIICSPFSLIADALGQPSLVTARNADAAANTLPGPFQSLDANTDGSLSAEEFGRFPGRPREVLDRDFQVFDADRNLRLNPVELQSIPYWGVEADRGPLSDPVVKLAQVYRDQLAKQWPDWDADRDGRLSPDEFAAAGLPRHVPGLDSTQWTDWDRDGDQFISTEDAAHLLDIAFGVRTAQGQLLRSPTGRVLDWRIFNGLDHDQDHRISRDDYLAAISPQVDDATGWLNSLDADADGLLSVEEFSRSHHRTDPASTFLQLDTDLNGRLTPDEFTSLSADQVLLAKHVFPAFDDDGDGGLSLPEYQLTPMVNLLTNWHVAEDTDTDGRLSLQEFRFGQGPVLAGLCGEYFRRLDVNQDGLIELPEWPFQSANVQIVNDAKFQSLDQDANGGLTELEFLNLGARGQPELRRDFQVFDADGNGELDRVEFVTIPHVGGADPRVRISDPVDALSRRYQEMLASRWSEWDRDSSQMLSARELDAADLSAAIPALADIAFNNWDRDQDGQVSPSEATLLLDIACGVRIPTGESLRAATGRVVDYVTFRNLKTDAQGMVSGEEYFRYLGNGVPNPEDWLSSIDKNGDNVFDYAEFSLGSHRTDPVSMFMGLDIDFDGRLTPSELEGLPAGWRQMALQALSGFDDNGDGGYSLFEYQLLPHVNLLAPWQAANDSDGDGRLSPSEFRFWPPPEQVLLSEAYFRRLDVDADGFLAVNEWSFHTTNVEVANDAAFVRLDADFDGGLTETEFLALGRFPAERLSRDFRIFDMNGDQKLSLSEFASNPHVAGRDRRARVTDPVIELSRERLNELTDNWTDRDGDGNRQLSKREFSAANPQRRIAGLETTGFSDWDRNNDGQLTAAEAALLLDMAYGVRTPRGDSLRLPAGYVVDWMTFSALRTNERGMVTQQEYFRSLGPHVPNREVWWNSIDRNGDGEFSFNEFALGNHRTDPVGTFIDLDQDLDGQLNAAELIGLPAHWRRPAQAAFQGFDDDDNGAISLSEYQLMPHVNLLAPWQSATDRNFDGQLSPAEFRFGDGVLFASLTAEYFRRLDTDADGKLDVGEWIFNVDAARVPREIVLRQRDLDDDGRLSRDEVLGDLLATAKNPSQQSALMRAEEAFLRADTNHDQYLDLDELTPEEGLEAVVPGATVRAKSTAVPPIVTVSNILDMDEDLVRKWLVIEFNILLVIGVAVYLYRKRGQDRG